MWNELFILKRANISICGLYKPKITLKKRSKKVKDQYDEDKAYALDNRLSSVGKATFIKLYPLVKQNLDIIQAKDNFKEAQ